MTKMIPECGHEVDLPCSTEPTRALCKKMCASELPCGHLCKKKCCEPCNQADCEEPLTTTKVNICGHHVTLSCKDFHEGELPVFPRLYSIHHQTNLIFLSSSRWRTNGETNSIPSYNLLETV
jgi:hypothetical protein